MLGRMDRVELLPSRMLEEGGGGTPGAHALQVVAQLA